MTTYFVSRHTGAKEWAQRQGVIVDQMLEHLDLNQLKSGDKVLGSLPVNLVAELNQKGVQYYHLTLPLPPELRGQEISAERMESLGAKLEQYTVTESEMAKPKIFLWSYIKSNYFFLKSSASHGMTLLLLCLVAVASVFFASDITLGIINWVTVVTAMLALMIWIGDLNRAWKASLPHRLSVFFVAPKEESVANVGDEGKKIVACYLRANMEGGSDSRSLAQQLSTQTIKQYIDSISLSAVSNIRLSFDAGGTEIYFHPNPVYLAQDKNYVNDIAVVINIHKFKSSLVNEWINWGDAELTEREQKIYSTKLFQSSDSFLVGGVGKTASDQQLHTIAEITEQFKPFAHIAKLLS